MSKSNQTVPVRVSELKKVRKALRTLGLFVAVCPSGYNLNKPLAQEPEVNQSMIALNDFLNEYL